MIRKADTQDYNALHTLYSNSFPQDYVNYFFEKEYDPFDTYLVEDNGEIAATIYAKKVDIMLKGYPVRAVFLKNPYRNALMREEANQRIMMQEILEEISYNNLLVFVRPEGNEIYKKMGFEPLYIQRQYTISRAQVPVYPTSMIYDTYEDIDLLHVYEQYASHFEGYGIRDLKYYQSKRIYNDAMNYRTLAYYSAEHKCEGYVVYDLSDDPIRIEEIVYVNSVAFLKLISYLLNLKGSIEFAVSPLEKISRMIPTAVGKLKTDIWAKIMDYSLLNRLLQSGYTTVNDLAEGSAKPLFYHD